MTKTTSIYLDPAPSRWRISNLASWQKVLGNVRSLLFGISSSRKWTSCPISDGTSSIVFASKYNSSRDASENRDTGKAYATVIYIDTVEFHEHIYLQLVAVQA